MGTCRYYIVLLVFGFLLCDTSNAMYPGLPTTMVQKNASTTTIGLLYSSTGATVFSDLRGVSNFSIYNGSSLYDIALSVRSNSCDLAVNDHFMIPASTGLIIDGVAVGKAICLRTLGSTSITYGSVFISAW